MSMERISRVLGGAVVVLVMMAGAADAADDFNPPDWVDLNDNNVRDNKDDEFLEPGEEMVIGVNPDWDPPANSTSYHWHWWPTQIEEYPEEYDTYDSGTAYLPDHAKNYFKYDEQSGTWSEQQPPPMPRNWGDFDPSALLASPRWEGMAIPQGAPRGTVINGAHIGVTWSQDDTSQPFRGVFEVPLYADLDMEKTLLRLQYGGGYGPDGDYTYWTTTLEAIEDGQVVPGVATRTYRSPIDGTIFYEDWEIIGTPDSIRLSIDFTGTSVDQVLIDTIAVPEPATMCLLGLGGAAALLRRRK